MSRFTLTVAALALLAVGGFSSPASARSNVEINLGFGFPMSAPEPYHHGYRHHPVYAAPAYYPPVVVRPMRPAPVVYSYAPAYAPAPQAFIDAYGRTCRNFQTIVNYSRVTGTACLQPDGSWRSVGY